MVMKINCEVEQNLVVTISYDDGTMKTKVVSVGDYVSVAYNYNGCRRVVTGTVSNIHANPANSQATRKDWYFIVNNDDPDAGNFGSVKILVVNLIDIEILRMKRQVNPVNTPNNAMRVTDIRLKAGYFQVSNNNGHTWKTVGIHPVSDVDIPEHSSLHQKIHDMIGSDQYENSDDFIRGIEKLIWDEVRKRQHHIQQCEDSDCDCHSQDNSGSIFEEG